MRIIAGKYRRRHLKSPADFKTRPTSDRLRETLFDIIGSRIDEETRFLDLCAGSGAVGIEALSRGAGFAEFVDKSRKACGLIEENLDLLEVPEEETTVIKKESVEYLKKCQKSFDIVYFDPPYSSDYWEILKKFGETGSTLLEADGILIVEHFTKKTLPDEVGELRRWRIVKQGDSSLSFYERN